MWEEQTNKMWDRRGKYTTFCFSQQQQKQVVVGRSRGGGETKRSSAKESTTVLHLKPQA
jgi:hypothetical protein